jgi:hypothetical protein
MAHHWHAGILNASSWHGLESVESIADAATLIRRGEETGAWPVGIQKVPMITADSGLAVPGGATVGTYADGSRKVYGAVGPAYKPLSPAEWRATIEAAEKAGAKPSGAFALYGGARVVATFEIPGGNGGTGLVNNLVIADSFDSSTKHIMGGTTIRVVCANTMSMMLGEQSHAAVRHTKSVDDAAKVLREQIEKHIATGETVRKLYADARQARLADFPKATIASFLETLYPTPDEQTRKDKPAVAKRMINEQDAFFQAMKRPENMDGGGTVAELWNAATYLVDRKADGTAREVRGDKDGSGRLASMLFGARGEQVREVQELVEELLANGQTRERTVIVSPSPESIAAAEMARRAHDAAAGKVDLNDYL